jgi:hypothetical protein
MSEGQPKETVPGGGSSVKPAKPKKDRSPPYPAIGLREAIDRARQFYTFARKNPARTTDAMKHWGFSEKSSGGRQVIASLLKFGLLEEEGRGEDRHIKLSRLALDILLDEQPESAERDELIQRAALRPKIHAHLWGKYGSEMPSEVVLRTYLIKDMEFTDTAVNDLIAEYKETIEFARIDQGGKIGGKAETPAVMQVGDYVQWTSGGVDQFLQPRRVTGVSNCGEWAFVEGSQTGVAMSELTKKEPPVEAGQAKAGGKTPPPNPNYAPAPGDRLDRSGTTAPEPLTGPSIRFDLPRGNVVEIRLKSKVTASEFKKLERIFKLSEVAFLEDDETPADEGDSDGGDELR